LLCQLDDRLDIQVAPDRLAGPAHLISLIGLEAMRREPVLVRVDRHRPNPQLVSRAEDPDCNLTTIGRHQLAKHGHRTIQLVDAAG
jgi:hypothetical protein